MPDVNPIRSRPDGSGTMVRRTFRRRRGRRLVVPTPGSTDTGTSDRQGRPTGDRHHPLTGPRHPMGPGRTPGLKPTLPLPGPGVSSWSEGCLVVAGRRSPLRGRTPDRVGQSVTAPRWKVSVDVKGMKDDEGTESEPRPVVVESGPNTVQKINRRNTGVNRGSQMTVLVTSSIGRFGSSRE